MSRRRPDIGFGGFFLLYWLGMPWAASVFVTSRAPAVISVVVLLVDTGLALFLAEVTSAWWSRRKSADRADAVVADEPRWARPLVARKAASEGTFKAAMCS